MYLPTVYDPAMLHYVVVRVLRRGQAGMIDEYAYAIAYLVTVEGLVIGCGDLAVLL